MEERFFRFEPARLEAAVEGIYLGRGGISSVYWTASDKVAKVTQVSASPVFHTSDTSRVQVDYLGDGTK